MKPKVGSLIRITNTEKLQPDSPEKKKEKAQFNKIRNESREVAMDITEIQRSKRDYYKQQYVSEIDNLEEMDKYFKGTITHD